MSYDWQPLKSYGCGEGGHMYRAFPKRGVGKEQNDTTVTTLVHITGNGPHHQRVTEEKRTKEAPHYVATDHA